MFIFVSLYIGETLEGNSEKFGICLGGELTGVEALEGCGDLWAVGSGMVIKGSSLLITIRPASTSLSTSCHKLLSSESCSKDMSGKCWSEGGRRGSWGPYWSLKAVFLQQVNKLERNSAELLEAKVAALKRSVPISLF